VNIAESVKARLKNIAVAEKKPFNYILMHYFIERLLYRLSISAYAGNFILKGGLLLYTVLGNKARTTRDIDLLASAGDFGHLDRVYSIFRLSETPMSPKIC
jgi:predicted nucleotidyltransferase component of viral defense system